MTPIDRAGPVGAADATSLGDSETKHHVVARRKAVHLGAGVLATGLTTLSLPSAVGAASVASGGSESELPYSAMIDDANREYGLFTNGVTSGVYLYIPYINVTGAPISLGTVTASSDAPFVDTDDTSVTWTQWTGAAGELYASDPEFNYTNGPGVGSIPAGGLFVARVSVLGPSSQVYAGNFMRLTQAGLAVTFEPVDFSDPWFND